LRREDHPALSAEGFNAVEAIGRDLSRAWRPGDQPNQGAGDYRIRPFLLRAFSAGNRGAALFAIYRLGPLEQRSAGFTFAAARFEVAGGKLAGYAVTGDQAGEAALQAASWQPRVAK
jgi:hypothetical protein